MESFLNETELMNENPLCCRVLTLLSSTKRSTNKFQQTDKQINIRLLEIISWYKTSCLKSTIMWYIKPVLLLSYKKSVSLIELQIREVVEADTAATRIERTNDFRVAVTKPKVYIHVHILIFMYSHIVNVFLEWVYTLYLSVFWYVRVLQEPTVLHWRLEQIWQ